MEENTTNNLTTILPSDIPKSSYERNKGTFGACGYVVWTSWSPLQDYFFVLHRYSKLQTLNIISLKFVKIQIYHTHY